MSSSPLKVESAAKPSEPSMEEILASIRKIISDDDSRPPAVPAPAPPAAPEQAHPPQGQDDIDALLAGFEDDTADVEVLELTEEMAAPSEQIEGSDLDFIDAPTPAEEVDVEPARSFAPELPPRLAEPAQAARSAPPFRPEDRLLSSATDSAIASAFGNLTHTVLSHNARTLDDLVQDMLRPMLKSWLDDNLPTLVERLVRAEIERVSRGGR